ncbi:MAG: hypothetical protein V4568_07360 [Pseudomonadota bacterium]
MNKLKQIWGGVFVLALICFVAGCGGGGGSGSSSSGTASVQGVATPSNVSVVTATNSN